LDNTYNVDRLLLRFDFWNIDLG